MLNFMLGQDATFYIHDEKRNLTGYRFSSFEPRLSAMGVLFRILSHSFGEFFLPNLQARTESLGLSLSSMTIRATTGSEW